MNRLSFVIDLLAVCGVLAIGYGLRELNPALVLIYGGALAAAAARWLAQLEKKPRG